MIIAVARTRTILAVFLSAIASYTGWSSDSDNAAELEKDQSNFLDPEDGYLDVSSFLDTAYGFIPIAMPITEPAVGYGLVGGLVFISKKEPKPGEEEGRPNMAAVIGGATENGTWLLGGGHSATWKNERIKTFVAGGYASANLDFFAPDDASVQYNLKAPFAMAEASYRIGDTELWVGAGLSYANTTLSFDDPEDVEIPDEIGSTLVAFNPMIVYDTRDNIFTPTAGLYLELSAQLYNDSIGSDEDFEQIDFAGIWYRQLSDTLYFGIRGAGKFTSDDTPFYARPFIGLRGTQAMKYQGDEVYESELELRWQAWNRFSLVGFVGAGRAEEEPFGIPSTENVVTGGVGLRYEAARRYGLHMGFDVAWGPDDPIFYIQFGSAWGQR